MNILLKAKKSESVAELQMIMLIATLHIQYKMIADSWLVEFSLILI